MPTTYGTMWEANLKKVIVLVLIYPFFIIWNVVISEKDIDFIMGGFLITYRKRVEWASLSEAKFISFVFTLAITLISTGITLSKMSKLKKRVLSSERHLCFATSLISLCFLICVLFAFYFSFIRKYVENDAITDIIYLSEYVAIDLLNVGSPIIMIMACKQLRDHVFFIKSTENGDNNGTAISFTKASSSNLYNNNVGHGTPN
uniref:Serpentine receptor class gamma n=1 Tax=Caenorhabditis japonica TaxID=281687 RepID=A0A8R1DRA8_CAEJA